MSRDVLQEATRALQRATAEPPPSSELTRARIMQRLHSQKRTRATRAVVWFPLAAIFIGASAAAATGKLPAILKAVSEVVGIAPTAPMPGSDVLAARNKPRTPRSRPQFAVANTPPPAPETEAEAEPEAEAVAEETSAENQNASDSSASLRLPITAGVVQATPVAAGAAKLAQEQARADALYRKAHQLHFVKRSPSAALAAWNRYLSAYPSDRLSLEARYNRALCLVRLGRYAEASPTLRRFASGRYGGYRKHDSQALLNALEPLSHTPLADGDARLR